MGVSRLYAGPLLHICLLLLLCVSGSLSILCFQCATTDGDHRCVSDYWGFVNDSKGLTDTYTKNCTATKDSWKYCMIETREAGGKVNLFHRGCTDGENFTFDDFRFQNLSPSNESTCADVENKGLVCYRLCNTDLCNGPQIPPNETDPCEGYDAAENYDRDDFPEFCGATQIQSVFTFLFVILLSLGVSCVQHFMF